MPAGQRFWPRDGRTSGRPAPTNLDARVENGRDAYLLLHRARPRDQGEEVKARHHQQQRLDTGHERNRLEQGPDHGPDHVGPQGKVLSWHNGKGANKDIAAKKGRDGGEGTHDHRLGGQRQGCKTGQVDKV